MAAKIDEKTYKIVKMMLCSGASNVEIAECIGLSDSTISNIKNSDNLDEYKEKVYKTSGYYRRKMAQETPKQVEMEIEKEPVQQIAETKQTVIVQASHYMLKAQEETNQLLKQISNKLAFIVEELTGVKQDEQH